MMLSQRNTHSTHSQGLGWESDSKQTKSESMCLVPIECPEDPQLNSELWEFPNPPTSLTILKSEPVTPTTATPGVATPDVSSASTPGDFQEEQLIYCPSPWVFKYTAHRTVIHHCISDSSEDFRSLIVLKTSDSVCYSAIRVQQ